MYETRQPLNWSLNASPTWPFLAVQATSEPLLIFLCAILLALCVLGQACPIFSRHNTEIDPSMGNVRFYCKTFCALTCPPDVISMAQLVQGHNSVRETIGLRKVQYYTGPLGHLRNYNVIHLSWLVRKTSLLKFLFEFTLAFFQYIRQWRFVVFSSHSAFPVQEKTLSYENPPPYQEWRSKANSGSTPLSTRSSKKHLRASMLSFPVKK